MDYVDSYNVLLDKPINDENKIDENKIVNTVVQNGGEKNKFKKRRYFPKYMYVKKNKNDTVGLNKEIDLTKNDSWTYYLFMIIPVIISNIVAYYFPMNNINLNQSSYTPPPIVFQIVWNILYLTLGYRLVNTKSQQVFRLILINLILTYLWVITFNVIQDYKLNLIILIILIFTTIYSMFLENNNVLIILTIPYLLWLCFATYLNYYLINYNY